MNKELDNFEVNDEKVLEKLKEIMAKNISYAEKLNELEVPHNRDDDLQGFIVPENKMKEDILRGIKAWKL